MTNQKRLIRWDAVKPTPIAFAIALLPSILLAQVAPNTTSADVPEARSLFETGGQSTIGPRPANSFLDRLSSPVEKIAVKVDGDNLAADGVTGTNVEVQLLDKNGQPIRETVEVTIEVSGGARILLPGRLTSESAADRGDVDKITPGVQAKATNGVLQFKLIAPYQPEAVNVRASVRGVAEKAVVRYVPDLREMIAVGLIEGTIRKDKFDPSKIEPARENDLFEKEIKNFSRDFSGGTGRVGARAALYLKGKIKGEYLLTMAYDSDKDTTRSLFESVDPNAFYPVYGDSSIRGQDAQSSGKLYVRLDKQRSYLLWGDYTTNDDNQARRLSAYNRSLPGLRGHYEEGKVVSNVFLAREALRQVVDEFAARGVSGPYSVSNPNGIKGTEKVEIVVRNRNQTSIILKVTPLTRESDYEFEPFDGRIVFRSPIPSVDDQLNPVSIRVTYEVEQGGDKYTVFGGDVSLKITDNTTVGVAFARDNNPAAPQTVAGANLSLKITPNTELIAEVASSKSVVNTNANGFNTNNSSNFAGKSGELSGQAGRVELRHSSDTARGNVYVMRADNDFNNASSGVTGGKQEIGGALTYKATDALTITAEARRSEDRILKSEDQSAMLALDLKVSDRLTIGGGVRHSQQNQVSLSQNASTNCLNSGTSTSSNLPGYNTGFGISQAGNQTIDPATGLPVICNTAINSIAAPTQDLDRNAVFARIGYKVNDQLTLQGELQRITGDDSANTIKLGARYNPTERLSFLAEVQREFGGDNDNNMYRLGADWRVADKTRVYSRYEYNRTYAGNYGLGVGEQQRTFALGIDTQYMQDGSLYSEYRLNDAASGKTIQNAIGLRNGWNVAEGLRLLTSAERLISSQGNSTALGLGLEYTASELWKSSGRVEWRRDSSNVNWLLTAGVARKLDRDWTLLAREYFSWLDPRNGSQETRQSRFQLGFAYRPVDNNRFDVLGLYERKNESTPSLNADVDIVSLRANYHPSRPWWITGRFAYKKRSDILEGNVPSSFKAHLLGARVTYDITNRWSLGGIATVMNGTGGRQSAYGLEVGYTLMDNLIVGVGYNWRGFKDSDLAGDGYTNRGWVINVRYKFDEDLFKGSDARVNRTLDPQGQPAIGTGAAPATQR
jgi:hypothetical protein